VQFVGFILEAHYSHVDSGETVNCNIPGEPTNDIHVAIGQALDAPECTSITAEIIPHFGRTHGQAWRRRTARPLLLIATRNNRRRRAS